MLSWAVKKYIHTLKSLWLDKRHLIERFPTLQQMRTNMRELCTLYTCVHDSLIAVNKNMYRGIDSMLLATSLMTNYIYHLIFWLHNHVLSLVANLHSMSHRLLPILIWGKKFLSILFLKRSAGQKLKIPKESRLPYFGTNKFWAVLDPVDLGTNTKVLDSTWFCTKMAPKCNQN